jgi:hypothetical protein
VCSSYLLAWRGCGDWSCQSCRRSLGLGGVRSFVVVFAGALLVGPPPSALPPPFVLSWSRSWQVDSGMGCSHRGVVVVVVATVRLSRGWHEYNCKLRVSKRM